MTADEAIAIVKGHLRGRTRFMGQEPFADEVLVEEIERLRCLLTAPLQADIEEIEKRWKVGRIVGSPTLEEFASVAIPDIRALLSAIRASEARAAAAYEDAAKIADEWNITQTLLLRAGEMTAQERRSVKAVVTAIAAAIRAKANGGK